MENIKKGITPHPQFLDTLFAYKSKVTRVFRDVLGLYEISHIAISRIDTHHQLLTFSSTPALEFNLFSSNLWYFDKTYQADWYHLCDQSPWQLLYEQTRYDELYYIKQIKHRYPLGLSLAAKLADSHVIYSIASRKDCEHTRELFTHEHDNFYKIGQYCTNTLLSLFTHYDHNFSKITQSQAEYEISK